MRGRLAVAAVPALAALLLGAWGTGRPSLWTDEIVTIDVARRPAGRIWELLGNIDAVHGLYYLLMHGWVQAAGFSPAAMRVPSVLAVAVTAAGIGLLGRALAGPGTGLLAGLVYACLPVAGQYALEARSYAMVAAVAVLATLALVRAVRSPRWFAGYAPALVLLGYLHLFAVLLIPAHLVTVLALRPGRRVLAAWTAAVAAACGAIAPLAYVAAGQRGAVKWIQPRDMEYLMHAVVSITGGVAATGLAGVLCVWGLVHWRAGELPKVAVPWLVLPPVILLTLSELEPLFVNRYLLFCVPALALLVAAGLTSCPRLVAVPTGVVLLLLVMSVQPGLRRPDSKYHDVTPVVRALAQNARPGDGLVMEPSVTRGLESAYPKVFRPLVDLTLAVPAADRAALLASQVGPRVLAQRLRGVDRVWMIRRYNGNRQVAARARARVAQFRAAGLTVRAGQWRAKRMKLTLYVRSGPAASQGAVTGK
ncbi:glycosyltransferase family 39 protein [Actinomadura macrotermitis]|uniref:Glycosyltransferase RgtA/B/C/D-like domain-containing protein n=1 Tax=Actinomadura macrotermitis TaxID=2585200 RepID=A0A7K0C276_9ACTN|nr:glycosyltransferase family 39 protein [Actinomadura macrotermitis]MQY07510.1 hypothetical protein [Actinomadura macrotermitis]